MYKNTNDVAHLVYSYLEDVSCFIFGLLKELIYKNSGARGFI